MAIIRKPLEEFLSFDCDRGKRRKRGGRADVGNCDEKPGREAAFKKVARRETSGNATNCGLRIGDASDPSPKKPLVEFDAAGAQETKVFLLKGDLPVMQLLIGDISPDFLDV